MPLWTFRCLNGHARDVYEHHPDDRGCRTILCETCGETMGPTSEDYGCGLTAMEEGRPFVMEHVGHDPITVRSWREYDKVLKTHGLAQAGTRRGHKGAWL